MPASQLGQSAWYVSHEVTGIAPCQGNPPSRSVLKREAGRFCYIAQKPSSLKITVYSGMPCGFRNVQPKNLVLIWPALLHHADFTYVSFLTLNERYVKAPHADVGE